MDLSLSDYLLRANSTNKIGVDFMVQKNKDAVDIDINYELNEVMSGSVSLEFNKSTIVIKQKLIISQPN